MGTEKVGDPATGFYHNMRTFGPCDVIWPTQTYHIFRWQGETCKSGGTLHCKGDRIGNPSIGGVNLRSQALSHHTDFEFWPGASSHPHILSHSGRPAGRGDWACLTEAFLHGAVKHASPLSRSSGTTAPAQCADGCVDEKRGAFSQRPALRWWPMPCPHDRRNGREVRGFAKAQMPQEVPKKVEKKTLKRVGSRNAAGGGACTGSKAGKAVKIMGGKWILGWFSETGSHAMKYPHPRKTRQ